LDEVEGGKMAQKRHTAEQTINKLREVEVAQAQGTRIPQAVKQIRVTEQTFYRWGREHGGMRLDQAKRLKELERENTRLKRPVTDLSLDNQILKEAAQGNF
jgi:cell division protein FtsB